MKRILIIISLLLLLTACGTSTPPETEPAPTLPSVTLPAMTDPPEITIPTTAAPTTAPPTELATEPPPTTEVPIPEPPPTTEAPESPLQAILEAALPADGTWSVYVKHLETGETVSIYDKPMVAASLIKLYVAGTVYAEEEGTADLPARQVYEMLAQSSNEACNALIDRLGMTAVNRFIRDQGWYDSVLNRKMLEQTLRENFTSTRECGELLERVLDGSFVSPTASEAILDALEHQARTHKLPAGVPAGVKTANKTGELLNTENDAAIVWSPSGVYIICVMSTDLSDPYAAQRTIVELSRVVYDYFNNQ